MTDFADLPRGHFGAIVADVPWPFRHFSPKGEDRAAVRHYDTMTMGEICDLPVAGLCLSDAMLVLWVPDTQLDKGLRVIADWGFKYSTVAFHWVKTNKAGDGLPIGMGYWTRANPEIALLATRGSPRRINRDVPRLIVAPRREHSRKPDQVYQRTKRLARGPYLDLFSRESRPGWTAYGHEMGKFG